MTAIIISTILRVHWFDYLFIYKHGNQTAMNMRVAPLCLEDGKTMNMRAGLSSGTEHESSKVNDNRMELCSLQNDQ